MTIGRLIHFINNIPLAWHVRTSRTILDVGCGVHSPINYFVRPHQVLDGLDISAWAVGQQLETRYRSIVVADIHTFSPKNRYDTVTALDFIEHFEKMDGLNVLEKLESIASDRVIIVTPNGFVPQKAEPNNPFQEHKSGWSVEEFTKRGYRVYGLFGPRWMREGTAMLKYRPKILWGMLALLSYPVYYFLPHRSFSLLAVYTKPKHTTLV